MASQMLKVSGSATGTGEWPRLPLILARPHQPGLCPLCGLDLLGWELWGSPPPSPLEPGNSLRAVFLRQLGAPSSTQSEVGPWAAVGAGVVFGGQDPLKLSDPTLPLPVSDLAPGQSGMDDMKLLEQRAEQLAAEAERDQPPRAQSKILFVR